jgi:hypothetical protein
VVVVAGLLVLAGLGLFITGILTDVTAWYWACVVACGLAAVLLVIARFRTPAVDRAPVPDGPGRRTGTTTAGPTTTGPSGPREPAGPATAAGPAAAEPPTRGRHGRHQAPDDDGPVVPTPAGTPASAPSSAAAAASAPVHDPTGDPAEEDVEVTDLLLVVDLADEVLVVDEHPRYHLADCPWPAGRPTVPLPVGEARTDGFTPCAVCRPDSHLAGVERARRAARRN